MSPDLRHATVFVIPLLGANAEAVLKALRTQHRLSAERGRAAGEHQICREAEIPARRELRRRQPYRSPAARAEGGARSGSGMKFGFALLAAVLVAAPLQAQSAGAEDARAAIAAVLAHQVSMRGPKGAADLRSRRAYRAAARARCRGPVGPEHAVRIHFQWHVPETPLPVRPPRVEPEPGERRERRERRRLLPERQLPPRLRRSWPASLTRCAAEASQSTTAPALAEIDAGIITAPLRVHAAGFELRAVAPFRPRLRRGRRLRAVDYALRCFLRRWQPLCAATARDAVGGRRRRRYLDQLGHFRSPPFHRDLAFIGDHLDRLAGPVDRRAPPRQVGGEGEAG